MVLKFKFLALNKINKAGILYTVWVLLLTSLGTEIKGQQNKYSFSDMNEFSEFIDIIKTKKEIPDKFKAKINASGLSWRNFYNEYRVISDTVININDENILISYNIKQLAELGRLNKQLVLYSPMGVFKDIIRIRTYSEDWSDGGTHYFYES